MKTTEKALFNFKELTQGDYISMKSPRYHVGDQWGAAMGLAFDVAGVAYERGLDNILDYAPGLGGVEDIEDDWRRDQLAAMNDADLIALMRFIKRVLTMLEKQGKAY